MLRISGDCVGGSRQGQVVHTAWGPADSWDDLGAHDALAVHALVGGAQRPMEFWMDSR